MLTAAEYAGGATLFAINWGCAVLAAWLVVSRRLPQLRGANAVVAGGLLTALGVFLTNLLPAAAAVLSQGTVVVCSLLWALGAWVLARRGLPSEPDAWPPKKAPARAGVILAWIGAGILVVWALGTAIGLARLPPQNIDTLSFHLPGIARWIQSGSIWQIDQLIPLVPTGQYPSTGNMIELSVVLPWHSDFAFRLVGVPFLALAGLGTYGLGRELEADRPTAVLIAAAAVSIPSVLGPALVTPLPDVIFVGCFSAGLCFLVRHFRTSLWSDLLLAGIGLGLAFGTKWYAVTSVPVLLAIWAVCWLLAKRGPRFVLTRGAAIGAVVLLLGGVWLLRNWIESGNPFYPAKLNLGPVGFDAPTDPRGAQVEGTVLDYLDNGEALWDAMLPSWLSNLGLAGYALALVVPVSLAFVISSWRAPAMSERRWLGVALVSSAAVLALVYAGTPSTAPVESGELPEVGFNSRYAVPALIVAAGCAAWVTARLQGRWLIAIQAVLLVCVIDGVARELSPGGGALLAAAAGLGGAVLAVRWLSRAEPGLSLARIRSMPARVQVGLAAATVGIVVAAGVAGYLVMRGFTEKGYGGYASTDYVLDHAREGSRIGITAAWGVDTVSPTRAMFGPRLRNRVEYVGEFRNGQLAPPRGMAEFKAILLRQHPDFLLVGRGYRQVKSDPKQAQWARALGFDEVASDGTLVLMRAPGAREQLGSR